MLHSMPLKQHVCESGEEWELQTKPQRCAWNPMGNAVTKLEVIQDKGNFLSC